MIKAKVAMALAVAAMLGGCARNIPATYTGGPPDPNSVTTFNLSLTPDSIVPCTQGDSSMERPMTMTVQNNSGTLLTSGGIHYGLTRVAPNVYAGGNYIKIRADLSSVPKTLTISSNDGRCSWAGGAP